MFFFLNRLITLEHQYTSIAFICIHWYDVFSAICNSGISYDIETESKVIDGMSGYTKLDFGTAQDCKDFCDPLNSCWGFAFTPSVPKCVMHDVFDDPFRLEDNQISVLAEDLYIKKCYFECKIFIFYFNLKCEYVNKEIEKDIDK